MNRFVAPFTLPFLFTATLALAAPGGGSPAATAGDYPTTAVVDYVLGCMRANGRTHKVVEDCSCSIDVIATILPYDHYERAETFQSMALMTGENAGLFRESKPARQARTELRRAQAEADVRCF
ncbi:MAG: hypothetical protein L0I29_04690 [Hyphomicrobiales bacterium]|nr:hypothetical protein [Hyphomicrobiales bacterium]